MNSRSFATGWGELFIAMGIAIGLLLAMSAAVSAQGRAKKRRKKLTDFAAQCGLSYSPDTGGLHERYASFAYFDRGDRRSRRSANLISGRRGGLEWEMFDFWNGPDGSEQKPRGGLGVVIANLPASFPKTRIRSESIIDHVSSFVGMNDIEFESEEFSRRYHVSASDRKFAYDLIHPRMMEYLLAAPTVDWQLGGRTILLIRSRRYRVDELSGAMKLVEGFVRLIPQYVRQDRGPL